MNHPAHGQIGYLQLPALDIAASARFYEAVFGWRVELTYASFEAPGIIGQFTTDRSPDPERGPVLWICAERLATTLARIEANGGVVLGPPQLDQGERWLTEVNDPAGNRIGVVVAVEAPQAQPLIAVRDVEASSRWYQQLLGLRSDHGGPHYERLVAGTTLVLQLHDRQTAHDHGPLGDRAGAGAATDAVGAGAGVLLWFGEVSDFDGVLERAAALGAPVVLGARRNPPAEEATNGPSHREVWITDPDGYTVVIASPDGEAYLPA